MEQINMIYEGGVGEIVEKKSKFIATIEPVKTEQEANDFIQRMKKKYWDAKHNCSAFIIGSNREITRCSDDGEPAQTAGRPMLDVLINAQVTDVAVVVTRYFGGVLLGTGGLVRAYQKAVQEGLEHCTILQKKVGDILNIIIDYNNLGKIQFLAGQEKIETISSEYAQNVSLDLLIPSERKEELQKMILDATNGIAAMEWKETVSYAKIGKEIKIFLT